MKRTAILPAIFFASTLSLSAQVKTGDTTELPPVEVRSTRASERAPFSKTNISKSTIEKQNLGRDLPFVISQTPSTVVSSDAGNGIGYTGLRIRGSDLSRINVTLNGIPYNDPESHGVFFVDLPDFASSLSSIQVQRGVGTSSNGPGAFGGTINLSTTEVNEKAYASLYNTYGSYNARRHTLKAGTGLLNNHFTLDARLSTISSDGFIDRATSDLRSYFISGAWLNKNSSVRLNVFSGKEKTYQAWNGIPEHKLFYNQDSLLTHYYNNLGVLYFTEADSVNLFTADPRKYNTYLYENQTDNYKQDHYQLFFNHAFSRFTLSTALFLTHGEGYYEQYKYNRKYSAYGLPDFMVGTTVIDQTDLINQLWLKNDLYGGIFSLQYKKNETDVTLGGSWNRFDGAHFGKVIWAAQGIPNDHEFYRFPALKEDANVYAKFGHKPLNKLYLMADMQYRIVKHDMKGTRNFPLLKVDRTYKFFNPKAGVSYLSGPFNAYLSFAVANKEPNRTDHETATGDEGPKPETLHDLETGLEYKQSKFNAGITGYYMKYRNQLVLTGKINDVGEPVRTNIPDSYRMGIETWLGAQLHKRINFQGNLSVSRNRLKNYADYVARYDAAFSFIKYDTVTYAESDISFSPWLTAAATLTITPIKNTEVALMGKGVSKQYLDNTSSNQKMLNGYFINDLQVRYNMAVRHLKGAEFIFQLNNIWNKKYESNGYTYSYIYDNTRIKENFYYPMAGTNFMLGVNVKL